MKYKKMRLFLLPWKRILYNYELKSCDMFLDVSLKRVGGGKARGGAGVARVDRYWSSNLNGTWYRRLFLTARPSNNEPAVTGIPVTSASAVTRD